MSDRPPRSRRSAVTHRTIAEQLGVSQSTVSLVLNGKAEGRVAPELSAAILATAQAVGYQPNAAARTLRLGESRVVALLVPQVDNPFFPPVYQGAERVASTRGYTIVLVNAEEQRDTQERVLATLAALAVEGFVVWRTPAVASVAALRQRLVLADDDDPELPSVQFDLAEGMRQAVAHLLALGHRSIALLAADIDHATFQLRQAALRASLAGADLQPTVTARAALTIDAARTAAAALLHHTPRPTGIICDDDLLAIGVYHAAAAAGVSIPTDLSVIGIGGTATAPWWARFSATATKRPGRVPGSSPIRRPSRATPRPPRFSTGLTPCPMPRQTRSMRRSRRRAGWTRPRSTPAGMGGRS